MFRLGISTLGPRRALYAACLILNIFSTSVWADPTPEDIAREILHLLADGKNEEAGTRMRGLGDETFLEVSSRLKLRIGEDGRSWYDQAIRTELPARYLRVVGALVEGGSWPELSRLEKTAKAGGQHLWYMEALTLQPQSPELTAYFIGKIRSSRDPEYVERLAFYLFQIDRPTRVSAGVVWAAYERMKQFAEEAPSVRESGSLSTLESVIFRLPFDELKSKVIDEVKTREDAERLAERFRFSETLEPEHLKRFLKRVFNPDVFPEAHSVNLTYQVEKLISSLGRSKFPEQERAGILIAFADAWLDRSASPRVAHTPIEKDITFVLSLLMEATNEPAEAELVLRHAFRRLASRPDLVEAEDFKGQLEYIELVNRRMLLRPTWAGIRKLFEQAGALAGDPAAFAEWAGVKCPYRRLKHDPKIAKGKRFPE